MADGLENLETCDAWAILFIWDTIAEDGWVRPGL
jgi:hypothetical protein